jgi:hypothetical protein
MATEYVEYKWRSHRLNQTSYKDIQGNFQSLVDHPVCQPSLDISPTWVPNIVTEVRYLQLCPLQIQYENCTLYADTTYRIYLFSDGFYHDNTLEFNNNNKNHEIVHGCGC